MMPEASFQGLLVVAAIALGAPLLAGLVPGVKVPAVVLEIVAGIVVGPSVLGWVELDEPIQVLSLVGLAFLLFLAGMEIDLGRLRGQLVRVASAGYAVTVALGVVGGLAFHAAGWVERPLLIAVALSGTSLGLVVPVLKDAGHLDRPLGQLTVAGATIADFAAVVLLSLLFSQTEGSTASKLVALGGFAAVVAVVALGVLGAEHSRRLSDVVLRLQDTTAEIRVRFAVLLLVAFVALAESVGLETILGAFVAGALLSALDRDASTHPHFRVKLEAIGYGFVIPVFFVTTGLRFDLDALIEAPSALARVPLLLLALLVVRGAPALLYRSALGRREAAGAGLLQATSLPLLVMAADIGVALGAVAPLTAAALISAGLLSVLVFPPAALGLLRGMLPGGPAPATATGPGATGPASGPGPTGPASGPGR